MKRDILTPAIVFTGVVIVILFLWAVMAGAQSSKTPINNGILQSDLNAAGYKITNANLVDYAGVNITWNAGTKKFDATGGGGGAPTTATYITQTADAGLSAEVPLSGLATGLLKSTITTGALTTITDSSTNWNTAFTQTRQWDGGSTGLTAATGRTSLGGTTVGQNFFTLTNPGAITWPEISALNAVTAVSAATMRTDLGLAIGTNVQAFDSDLSLWAAITPAANVGTFLATPSSANLAAAVTDETGTGSLVFGTSPTVSTKLTVSGTPGSGVEISNGAGGAFNDVVLRNNTASSRTTFYVMPRGTVTTIPSGFQFFGTDYLADSTNYEMFAIFSKGSSDTYYTMGTTASGTGTRRPLAIAADGTTTQILLPTNGGISVNSATAPGAGVVNANTGFQVAGAAASGKVLIGNATNFVPSTPTYPNAATPTALKWLRADGTNWIASTATLAEGAVTAGKILQSDATNWVASTPTWPTTAGTAGYTLRSDGTNIASYPQDMYNSSTASVTSSYNADTYLAGSSVVVAAGDIKLKGQYHCVFDMAKAGAGTGAPVITVRAGTAGTTGDTAIMTFTFGAGTGVADLGVFDVWVNIRTTGASATSTGTCLGRHNLATTGIFNNAAVFTVTGAANASFNSTTATTIGLSFSGGTTFTGTNTLVQATLIQ